MPRVSVIIPTYNRREYVQRLRKVSSMLRRAIVLVLLWMVGRTAFLPGPVWAQDVPSEWSAPIPLTESIGYRSVPRILSNGDGRLHVLWIENPTPDREANTEEAVFYTVGDGANWSQPVDVLVSPSGGSITGISAVLDDGGRIHLVLVDSGNSLPYYASVDLEQAGRPLSWTELQTLVFERVFEASLQYAGDRLYCTYILSTEPFDLMFMRSDDLGITWSRPVRVFRTEGTDQIAQEARLVIGADGALHLAWALYTLPDGYPPQGIVYSRSADEGQTWSPPYEFDLGQYALPSLVIGPSNSLYLTYNGAVAIGGRYFHWSSDGGLTWSEQITISPGVGGLTGGTIAVDSAGTVHFASASDTGINGIAYSQWDGAAWTPLIDLAQTPPDTDRRNRQGYEPNLIVNEGNQIHVVFLGEDHGSVLYTAARSSAPPLPRATARPSPTLQPSVLPMATAGTDSEPTGTPPPAARQIDPPVEGAGRSASTAPMVFGVLPALLTVILVMVVYLMRARSSGRGR